MAFLKYCDLESCGRAMDERPFLEIHGSISEQIEGIEQLKFRYLTERGRPKLVFCNFSCLRDWIKQRQLEEPFVEQASKRGYPQVEY